jgi:serine/threonine protein kinase
LIIEKGVIHRDFKPPNVLIHEGVLKIGDLGFAK